VVKPLCAQLSSACDNQCRNTSRRSATVRAPLAKKSEIYKRNHRACGGAWLWPTCERRSLRRAAPNRGARRELVTGFPIVPQASIPWYHSHTHGKTDPPVYKSLAGMIIIDDDGTLLYNQRGKGLFYAEHVMVNGIIQPRTNVPRGLVRLSLLNEMEAAEAQLKSLGVEPIMTRAIVANLDEVLKKGFQPYLTAQFRRAVKVSKFTMDADWPLFHPTPRKPTCVPPSSRRPDRPTRHSGLIVGGEFDRFIQLKAHNKKFWSKVSCPPSLSRKSFCI